MHAAAAAAAASASDDDVTDQRLWPAYKPMLTHSITHRCRYNNGDNMCQSVFNKSLLQLN